MVLFNRENLIYILIGISSCITYLFGQHAYLPQSMKVLLGLSNFIASFIMIIRSLESRNYQQDIFHKISIFVIIYTIFSITFALIDAPYRFQTFLFSPFYLLTYLLPLFYLLADDFNFFRKFFKLYIIIAIISLFSMRGFGLACYFIGIFFPALIKNKKLIILFSLILFLDLIYSFNILGTLRDSQRQLGVELVIAGITVYVVWLKRNKHLAKIISWTLCIIPIIIWAMFIIYNISIFEVFSGEIDDAIMKLDTRTFLYQEFLSNLHNLNDWVFGFGIDGGYVSQWFGANASSGGRETIEVTMLHLILKGGLILLFCYIYYIISGIIKAFKNGQNCLVYACAVMLSGHLVCMCIGDYPSRSLLIQIMPFIMVGICTNEKILSLNDKELKDILNLP